RPPFYDLDGTTKQVDRAFGSLAPMWALDLRKRKGNLLSGQSIFG
ncbi:MAG: hypothetical protein ACJA06_002219, partial [Halocynthiibacter sp.]